MGDSAGIAFSGDVRGGALSLSQFAKAVGDSIRSNPALQGTWIVAELSDVRIAGGHCYMELIEKDSRGTTVAKMRGVIWQSTFLSLRMKFGAATGRDIQSGLKVMVRGTATHHNLYGLSVQISDIDPSYTLGDMERLRREILQRLAKEGIINDNKQYLLPPDPLRVAVVSAEGAAGYGDFMKQLDGNRYGFRFRTHLFPALLQGERTSASIREALGLIENNLSDWDCVAIIRGGGATSDLNGFDDYELARAVALFPLPVLVGIGHERDRTVLDEIAHTRLKTPTAVGAFLVDRVADAYTVALDLGRQVSDFAAERLNGEKLRLSHLESTLPMLAKSRLSESRLTLSRLAASLPALASGRTARAMAMLDSFPRMIQAATDTRLRAESERVERNENLLKETLSRILSAESERLVGMENLVDALSPEATLRRGYSVTRANGKVVTDVSLLSSGQQLSIQLADGEIYSTVSSVSPKTD